MNLLDENFPADQSLLLADWGIPFRQIGRELSAAGTDDSAIIPLLHHRRGATLFTLDQDFFHPQLCHPAYCLVWLDVKADDAAFYVRRFLRHASFNTKARRMGVVARLHAAGIQCWRRGAHRPESMPWP